MCYITKLHFLGKKERQKKAKDKVIIFSIPHKTWNAIFLVLAAWHISMISKIG